MDNTPRAEEQERMVQSERLSQQKAKWYPQEKYHSPPPRRHSYYHTTYPESYPIEHLPPAHRAYYDTAYPSDYYNPHRSYSYLYPSGYSSQYYPEYMTYSHSNRQPAYPSSYHPSLSQSHVAQSQPSYSEHGSTSTSIDKDEIDKKEREEKPFQSYMLWSVLNCIFCWGILGAIAMVNSFKARQKHKRGFVKGAKKHQRCALWLNTIGTLVGIVATVVVIIYWVIRDEHMMAIFSEQ